MGMGQHGCAVRLSLYRSLLGAAAIATPTFAFTSTSPAETFITFDAPADARVTAPAAINNNGDIAGRYVTDTDEQIGFLRDFGGAFATFKVKNSGETVAAGINDKQETVGSFQGKDGGFHCFFRRPNG